MPKKNNTNVRPLEKIPAGKAVGVEERFLLLCAKQRSVSKNCYAQSGKKKGKPHDSILPGCFLICAFMNVMNLSSSLFIRKIAAARNSSMAITIIIS